MRSSFDTNGRLPPGIHITTWHEIEERFGWTPKRQRLLRGLKRAALALKKAGCRDLYVDGSFVTAKDDPSDFDACWSIEGVDAEKLDPVLLDFDNGRLKQKLKYGGELFPASSVADPNTLEVFMDFFQTDKEDGTPKGIVALDLRRLS